jgi:hypothetical protein
MRFAAVFPCDGKQAVNLLAWLKYFRLIVADFMQSLVVLSVCSRHSWGGRI